MKKIILIAAIFISFTVYAQTGEKNFIDQNYIEVVGKSEMDVTPDMIFIRIILNEKDTKNKVSISDLEQQMASKLREMGIDISHDLQIIDMASNFKNFFLSKKEILLSKEYQLMVRDGKTASRVFIEFEKIGISNVSIARLENSKIEQFRKEVKINAIQAAKEKAEFLALAIDQSIGRAIYIQEMGYHGGSPAQANRIMIRGFGNLTAKAELEVEFENIKLESSIICKFELK